MAEVRVRVRVRGARALVQHAFTPEAIPLEAREKTGTAGNDPEEWRRTCLLTDERQLYVPGTYVFSCLKSGARYTKKGRGSIQGMVVATLEVEEDLVLINRFAPAEKLLTQQRLPTPQDPKVMTFILVSTVRNPSTKGRNIRYRLATRAGWECEFTLKFDSTIVSREQMKMVVRDAGRFGGLGDGISVGMGRFGVVSYVELSGESEAAEGSVGGNEAEGVGEGRGSLPKVRQNGPVRQPAAR